MRFNTKKKIIALILFSIIAVLFFIYMPKESGNLNFDVKTTKTQAIQKANSLCEKQGLEVKDSDTVASFSLDQQSQTYYELEVGNYKKLNTLIQKEEGYIPASWTVSIVPKSGKNKVDVYLTPSGNIYGFNYKIPDDSKGASLTQEQAEGIGEKEATTNWNFILSEYSLIDKSKKTQTNGRVDYTFKYERYTKIGEARDIVELGLAGDKLVSMKHVLDVPESFQRKYEERRSANNTIALAALLTFYVLIFIIGFFCFSYLSKRKTIVWKKPLIFSGLIILLSFLSGIAGIKVALTSIDTFFFTPTIFYILMLIGLIFTGIFTAIFTFIAMSIGEGLSRRAFPKHLSFWKMLSIKNLGSWEFLDRVIIAYVFVILMLIYETLFYGTVNRFPGWWQPASMVIDPNVREDWFGWLTGFTNALNTGFFEEFGFRAIPISLGVLIGNKFNKRKLGIVIAFIFEILMFSAAHANYPGFPAYARLVELLFVAFGFGLMFYYFGIIPGIIAHFVYDFVLMTLNIMTNSGTALVYQKVLIAIIVAFPLLIAIYGRVRNKAWINVDAKDYNDADQGIEIDAKHTIDNSFALNINEEPIEEKTIATKNTGKQNIVLLISSMVLGIAIIFGLFSLNTAIPPLHTEKQEAVNLAKQELENRGFKLSTEWKILSYVQTSASNGSGLADMDSSNNIVKLDGKDKFKALIGNYINPLQWKIRFIKTTGDVNERAEEFDVNVIDKNHKINVTHILPKNRKGEILTKEKAKLVLLAEIKAKYGLEEASLKEISANETKLDNRTDWSFILEDTTIKLKDYKAEINGVVSGNEVLQLTKTLKLPQDKQRSLLQKIMIFGLIGFIILLPFIISMVVVLIKSVIAWTQNQISKPVFFRLFIILLVLNFASLFLDIPSKIMEFSTATPFNVQLITALVLGTIGYIILSFLEASIIAYAKHQYENVSKDTCFMQGISVVAGLLIFALGIIFISKPLLKVDNSIYCTLSSYSKLLSQIAHVGTSYLGNLTILFAVIAFVNKLKNKYVKLIFSIILFLTIGFVSLGNFSSPIMILIGILTGIIYILLYKLFFKHSLALAALTIGVVEILDKIKGLVLNQYPPLSTSIIISIIVLIGLIAYTYRTMTESY